MAVKKDSPFFPFMAHIQRKIFEKGIWNRFMEDHKNAVRIRSKGCPDQDNGVKS